MPFFRIIGAEIASGASVELNIEAIDSAEARIKANRMGIAVAGLEHSAEPRGSATSESFFTRRRGRHHRSDLFDRLIEYLVFQRFVAKLLIMTIFYLVVILGLIVAIVPSFQGRAIVPLVAQVGYSLEVRLLFWLVGVIYARVICEILLLVFNGVEALMSIADSQRALRRVAEAAQR